MCEWGTSLPVEVVIPADLSHTGEARRKIVDVDACIQPIVKALNEAGIVTIGSCCGHERGPGSIELEDGRQLLVRPPDVRPAPTVGAPEGREREECPWCKGEIHRTANGFTVEFMGADAVKVAALRAQGEKPPAADEGPRAIRLWVEGPRSPDDRSAVFGTILRGWDKAEIEWLAGVLSNRTAPPAAERITWLRE